MAELPRRSVAKGAAWSIPAVTVAASAPALAASTPTCSSQAIAAIDNAFAAVQSSLVAYWTIDTVSQLDGTGGARPYLNINNNSPYDLVTTTTPLVVTLDSYFQSASAGQWRGDFFTSYGVVNGVTSGSSATSKPVTYNGRQAGEVVWSAGAGSAILGNGNGKDNTADIAFGNPSSLLASPPGTIVCARLNSVPDIKPSFASIQAADSSVTAACQTYYNNKAAITPSIVFSGPLLSGTTRWGSGGSMYTLNGGSQAWAVGSTICSNTVGNYVSDTFPPSAHGIAYGYNGIF